jgi:hypothetical protein
MTDGEMEHAITNYQSTTPFSWAFFYCSYNCILSHIKILTPAACNFFAHGSIPSSPIDQLDR